MITDIQTIKWNKMIVCNWRIYFYILIAFNNTLKPIFLNKKYPVTIQTRKIFFLLFRGRAFKNQHEVTGMVSKMALDWQSYTIYFKKSKKQSLQKNDFVLG